MEHACTHVGNILECYKATTLTTAINNCYESSYYFLIAQLVENLPAMQQTPVQYLGWEDHLEKEMAIQSTILAWRIPWTKQPGHKRRTRLSN